MSSAPQNLTEVISGILTLGAAKRTKRIPLREIYSILHEMRATEPLLSGIRFSITGSVCYSRQIDNAIRTLVDRGTLKMENDSTVVVAPTHMFRTRLLEILTYSQFHSLLSASRHFHERLLGAPDTAETAAQ